MNQNPPRILEKLSQDTGWKIDRHGYVNELTGVGGGDFMCNWTAHFGDLRISGEGIFVPEYRDANKNLCPPTFSIECKYDGHREKSHTVIFRFKENLARIACEKLNKDTVFHTVCRKHVFNATGPSIYYVDALTIQEPISTQKAISVLLTNVTLETVEHFTRGESHSSKTLTINY